MFAGEAGPHGQVHRAGQGERVRRASPPARAWRAAQPLFVLGVLLLLGAVVAELRAKQLL
jgi:hypothetical protein